jgi:hypothetical protein
MRKLLFQDSRFSGQQKVGKWEFGVGAGLSRSPEWGRKKLQSMQTAQVE